MSEIIQTPLGILVGLKAPKGPKELKMLKKEKLARLKDANEKIKQDPLSSFTDVKIPKRPINVRQEKLACFKELEQTKKAETMNEIIKQDKLLSFHDIETSKKAENMENEEKEVQK